MSAVRADLLPCPLSDMVNRSLPISRGRAPMRKADYLTLARTIRAYARGAHASHVQDMARELARSLSVDRAAFLTACGIGAAPHSPGNAILTTRQEPRAPGADMP